MRSSFTTAGPCVPGEHYKLRRSAAERGHAYMAAFCRGLWSAFPDLDYEIHDLFGEHDRVYVRFTVRGTHAGPFAGIQLTHRTVACQIIDISASWAGSSPAAGA